MALVNQVVCEEYRAETVTVYVFASKTFEEAAKRTELVVVELIRDIVALAGE